MDYDFYSKLKFQNLGLENIEKKKNLLLTSKKNGAGESETRY